MTDWKWNGSRWWKCDFHAHTPASVDYGKGSDQVALKQRTPKEWLLDYMRAGIDCVAITDHNSGAWVDLVKAALRELESETPESYMSAVPGLVSCMRGESELMTSLILLRQKNGGIAQWGHHT